MSQSVEIQKKKYRERGKSTKGTRVKSKAAYDYGRWLPTNGDNHLNDKFPHLEGI